ncbi:YwgA family protein [Brevibacillus composti]|uniref:YwgA family protein n=1 Tax=Brevibacillus composti TaxID=2796470 RepID=A0A7T5EKG0_9BACL|nr:YwgA family protein [Brevibacillus composti]QQE74274.1 YwgA family protein [Brevibacillus composti]QUO41356.1 YwgA family protein [Brevibacillus composti]
MLKRHAKIIRLIEIVGEVSGRKKLQKMVYIAKQLDIDFDERFEFHMYGPYSEELTLRVDELCNMGLLDEQVETKGAIHMYRYTLNDTGRDFLRFHEVDFGKGEEVILRMNEENSRFLELVSTILYFNHLPYEEMKAKIFTFKSKQRYSEEEIQKGLQLIEELRALMKANPAALM